MKVEFVSYDGSYPNLCGGVLIVTVGNKRYEFEEHALMSGGSCWIDRYDEENVAQDDWEIVKWPNGFPEEAKADVVELVNENVEYGCCGGCL
jgi:hypothetical protein